MPIRAYCTICSDYFDHSRDVAAIHCGHTFHYDCLLQWFQTAPTKTCPQCRKQVSTRHIINKLFFDVAAEEEEGSADPDILQNELGRMKALLSSKERDWREKQKAMDGLKELVDKQRRDLDRGRKEVVEKESLCSVLRKQMMHLETQQKDTQVAKEELQRLRAKVKTFESLDVMLQGRRDEVESMVRDMGVSHSAVEQLSIYCISLKKEYDNLKGSLKSSLEMCEKLKREVLSSNNKFHKASAELNQVKDDMRSAQKDLTNADKEITSLKKKVGFLQKALSTPTQTTETLSRLIFESPAPLELKQPHLRLPDDSEDIDLNMTYDITTPESTAKKSTNKMFLDPSVTTKPNSRSSSVSQAPQDEGSMDMKNSLLFRKKTFGSMLEPQRKAGAVRTGYDGLGGRTKFIRPSVSEIRPLIKAKRKKVTRPAPLTLDIFLE